jgi:hypothetical protein
VAGLAIEALHPAMENWHRIRLRRAGKTAAMTTFSFRFTPSLAVIITVICTAAICLVMPSGVAQPADSPSPVKAVECQSAGRATQLLRQGEGGR